MSRFVVEITGIVDAAQGMSRVPALILQTQRRSLETLRRKLGTEAKRDIGAEYNLRAGRIADGLRTRFTPDGVALIGKSRGINAIEFGATWTKRHGSGVIAKLSRANRAAIRFGGALRGSTGEGARYAIKRGGARRVHPGSFIARGKNGTMLVFHRSGKSRLPIESLYGPSVGQMLKHGRRPERLVDFAIGVLQDEQKRLLGAAPTEST